MTTVQEHVKKGKKVREEISSKLLQESDRLRDLAKQFERPVAKAKTPRARRKARAQKHQKLTHERTRLDVAEALLEAQETSKRRKKSRDGVFTTIMIAKGYRLRNDNPGDITDPREWQKVETVA